jgi:hypothetical protein
MLVGARAYKDEADEPPAHVPLGLRLAR